MDTPSGIRTHVAAVKGRRPRPLADGGERREDTDDGAILGPPGWLSDPSDAISTLVFMGSRRRARSVEIEACPVCARQLAQPVWWRRLTGDRWLIVMRCPDCSAEYADELDDGQVRILDDGMHMHRAYLEAHLQAIEQAAATAEVERFADALATGELSPDDFRG